MVHVIRKARYPGLHNAVTKDHVGVRRLNNHLRPEAYLCEHGLEFGGCGDCDKTEEHMRPADNTTY